MQTDSHVQLNSTSQPRPAARRWVTLGAVLAVAVTFASGGAGGSQGASQRGMQTQTGSYRAAPAPIAPYYPSVYPGQRILTSARVDEARATVTLPLYRGKLRDGRLVWYVMTDVSDARVAAAKGLNYATKLRNLPARAARTATMNADGTLTFDRGTVDFTPEHKLVPGQAPNFFPPAVAQAGSLGDADYSPYVRVTNAGNVVYNATMIAFDVPASQIEFPAGNIDYSKVIDRATAISPARGTVTLELNLGTSGGRAIYFVSLDSNDNLVSTLENTTNAPALKAIPVDRDDAPGSAVAVDYIITHGAMGQGNPQRQGVNSALGEKGAEVFDIFDGAPGVLNGEAYSPAWSLYLARWTPDALEKGYASAIRSELEFVGLAKRGFLTTPDGKTVGPSGLISNCPLVMHY